MASLVVGIPENRRREGKAEEKKEMRDGGGRKERKLILRGENEREAQTRAETQVTEQQRNANTRMGERSKRKSTRKDTEKGGRTKNGQETTQRKRKTQHQKKGKDHQSKGRPCEIMSQRGAALRASGGQAHAPQRQKAELRGIEEDCMIAQWRHNRVWCTASSKLL